MGWVWWALSWGFVTLARASDDTSTCEIALTPAPPPALHTSCTFVANGAESPLLCHSAAFGAGRGSAITAATVLAAPMHGCSELSNARQVNGRIAVMWRGQCEFGDKALMAMAAGAVGLVVIDQVDRPKKLVRMKTVQDKAKLLEIPMVSVLKSEGNKLVELSTGGDCQLRIIFKQTVLNILEARQKRAMKLEKRPSQIVAQDIVRILRMPKSEYSGLTPEVSQQAVGLGLDLVWLMRDVLEKDWLQEHMLAGVTFTVHYDVSAIPRNAANVLFVANRGSIKTLLAHPTFQQKPWRRTGVIHLSDEANLDDVSFYDKFDYVFRNYWLQERMQRHVSWFPLGIKSGFAPSPKRATKSSQRTYLCAFVGNVEPGTLASSVVLQPVESITPEDIALVRSNKAHYIPDRKQMLKHLTARTDHTTAWAEFLASSADSQSGSCYLKVSTKFNNNNSSEALSTESYRDVLERSTFSLCPSGTNEETFRVWESLTAGSIPILKRGVEWTPLGEHPLPTVDSWDEIEVVLSTFMSDAGLLDDLQARVAAWWEWFRSLHQHKFTMAAAHT